MISEKTSNLILQQGVYIHPRFQNEETIKLCLECYAWMIASLISSIEGTIIYAEPISPANNTLLRLLGFVSSRKKSRLGRDLYEKRLDNINDESYLIVQNIIEKFNSRNNFSDFNYN